ncbi:protein of unknown function [Acidithiobacillus ferrivorans]|uniref:Uncharacterized protein n=1 Tax=Acidithiobacillus ferrivorans TaxID=160808 RepID=A0A060UQ89_9PROT|nr:hypothetical protein AFERRI_140018 [Acidithiobacillus ferrivorans]CDQ11677.1 hypothetical protein AFERRI_580010 [Acidithiobacillus ferrivorans]SMH66699.1 protein of unknown function [Acidithiobacillus ferrivorans]
MHISWWDVPSVMVNPTVFIQLNLVAIQWMI